MLNWHRLLGSSLTDEVCVTPCLMTKKAVQAVDTEMPRQMALDSGAPHNPRRSCPCATTSNILCSDRAEPWTSPRLQTTRKTPVGAWGEFRRGGRRFGIIKKI